MRRYRMDEIGWCWSALEGKELYQQITWLLRYRK